MKWTTLLLLGFTLFSFQLRAQILDTLIKKHRNAVGFEQAQKKIGPYKAQYVFETAGNRTELEVFRGAGKLLRVNKKYFYRGQAIHPEKKYFDIINEQGGWSLEPDQLDTLPRRLSDYEITRLLESYDWDDPLLDYNKRNIRIDYLSTEYFNETFYHKLLAHYPNGKQEYFFLHPETFLIDRRILNDPSIIDDQTITEYQVLLQNTRWPATIEMGDSRRRLVSIRPNATLDPNLFKSPVKK